MFVALEVAQQCLTFLRDTTSLGESVAHAGSGGVSAEQEALRVLLTVTSEALTAADYLAMLGSVSSSSHHQVAVTAAGCLLVEELVGVTSLPSGARPLLRTAVVYALASELVAQHHVRGDVRGILDVVARLATATHDVRRVAGPDAIAAADELMTAVERCYAKLPGVASPWTRVLRPSRMRGRDAEFREAVKAAWRVHAALVDVKVVRVGVLRRQELRYPAAAGSPAASSGS